MKIAKVKSEVLSDKSIVYNVIVEDISTMIYHLNDTVRQLNVTMKKRSR